MLSVVSKVFSHRAPGVGGQVLKGSGIGGSSGNNDGIFHGVRVCQTFYDLCHGGPFLAHGHIDTIQFYFLICSIIYALLIDYGI